MDRADGQGERGGAVGVAVRGGVGAVEDVAGIGCDAVDGVQVFANVAGDGDEELARLKGSGEAGEQVGFEGAGEGTEFDAMATEFAMEKIAETDTGAGKVEAGFVAEFKARAEDFELFWSGEVAENENLAGEAHVSGMNRSD